MGRGSFDATREFLVNLIVEMRANHSSGSHSKRIIRIALWSVFAGLSVAAFMMSVAWNHNPQGEFHLDGVIQWRPWLLVGVSWFVPVATCMGGLLCVLLRPWRA